MDCVMFVLFSSAAIVLIAVGSRDRWLNTEGLPEDVTAGEGMTRTPIGFGS
ncbi:hypothetical protein SAMN05444158_0883 [Bradyrhizobium canariense]|uniref:Uncharacterized protein n=1 Tax=Bradyrhizobium canariense TaxID=255045 RepID=A0A1H1P5A0_9BRAD|nr:hypothetical protein SAMN05444158_0883 [Bradyrhizobium canariense]